jgi:quinol-cytochrome oxidoreductase complex cytochrome b subunit
LDPIEDFAVQPEARLAAGNEPEVAAMRGAVVRGRTPVVGRAPEGSVPSWPNLMWAEMAAFVFTVAATLALGYFFDVPLKEMANPAIPENPAKAPWYFLGLQELVSYPAFMGGVGIPAVVLIGLGLIPYIDRDPSDAAW